MLTSGETYQVIQDEGIPKGLSLVCALTGFTDAGNTLTQLVEYFTSDPERVELISFNNDLLFDYRARRPMLTFDSDHLENYEPHELKLYLMHDALQKPFLLLAGYEPDFRWETFSVELQQIIEDLGVIDTTWVQALPMPVPHTRKIGSTVSGNRKTLIEQHSVWMPKTKIPANIMQFIEYQLYNHDKEVCGFSLLIPHYLADNNYPTALVTALDRISSATGLLFHYEEVLEHEKEFMVKLEDQIGDNPELLRMVEQLEKRHDQYMEKFKTNRDTTNLIEIEGDLPSAEDLAAEFERFLAAREQDEESGE